MRKLTVILTVLIITAMIAMISIPSSSNCQNKAAKAQASLPDNINKIVQNSCITCHAKGGNGMASSHVNFSNWETYSPEKQADKAAAMCKQMTKGSMPPKGFKKNHPDAVPTDEQVKAVCDWAAVLIKK